MITRRHFLALLAAGGSFGMLKAWLGRPVLSASSDIAGSRTDGSRKLPIPVGGSLQNPAWSPDGRSLLFTRFRNGYNEGPADLMIFDMGTGLVRTLVSDGSDNINLPGTCWNPVTDLIAFSSSREPHDEIYVIPSDGRPGDERMVTNRAGLMAYEPTFSADGEWIAFESHVVDVEGGGVIAKCHLDGRQVRYLTDVGDDCRQPNWSPADDILVYQRRGSIGWGLWIMDCDGDDKRQIAIGDGDKTDASFSPDGEWVIYSSDEGVLEHANLYAVRADGGNPIRLTRYRGYDGAPAWSPDRHMIAFESYPGDPDGSNGTDIWIIEL